MDDLTLLMDNALTFFPRLSQQSMDAIALQRIIITKYTQLKGEWWGCSEGVVIGGGWRFWDMVNMSEGKV